MDKLIVDSKKVAEIKYKALQKLAANQDRPLSEASIEARAVIEVVNEIYELNEVSPQVNPAIKKIDNITYKEIISEEELKTYKGTLEWEDNKKYLILYGTGSYSITTGSKEDIDEEIIRTYRETLKKTLR